MGTKVKSPEERNARKQALLAKREREREEQECKKESEVQETLAALDQLEAYLVKLGANAVPAATDAPKRMRQR